MRLLKSFAWGLILGAVMACPANAIEPDAPQQLITRVDVIAIEVLKRVDTGFKAGSETDYEKNEHSALAEYYSDRDNKPVWVNSKGLTPRARATVKEFSLAGNYGLRASDYSLPKLEDVKSREKLSAARLAEAEFTLSRLMLAYVRDARGGRIPPQTLSKHLDPTLNLPDPLSVMQKIAHHPNPALYLRGFHPQHPQFEALRQILLQLRGGSEPRKRIVIPNGPVIKLGQTHKQIKLIRKRLDVPVPLRDRKPLFPAEVYDPALETAVKEFQKSQGVNADGIIGPATRRRMNARPKIRVRTILTNMERWRWIPDGQTDNLNVQVNVPEFMVRVYDGQKPIFTERVVVGKLANQTPIFSDEMEFVVFHPYWNVPNSIKIAEILPYLKWGGGWFSSDSRPRIMRAQNLYVKYRGRSVNASSIDWNRVDIRAYQFYQPPGGPNVLGKVKFMFPNEHSVYLHDTPTKSLFARPVRAYSHGCMRVRNPRKLAEVLLGRDSGWSSGQVAAAIQNGRNHRVDLKTPIPVHVTYFTARVQKNGRVQYFGDTYGHDAKMARALKL